MCKKNVYQVKRTYKIKYPIHGYIFFCNIKKYAVRKEGWWFTLFYDE